MSENMYKVISRFQCNDKKMVIVSRKGSVSVMNEKDYNTIVYRELENNKEVL